MSMLSTHTRWHSMVSQIGRGLAVALFLSIPLFAQRTWIVDQKNGTGTDFTTLPSAVTAAKDGDRILVRPGSYFGPRTSKGLTIVGFIGARLKVTSTASNTRIANLPAGKRFVLAGFEFDWLLSRGPAVEVWECKGLVVLSALASAANIQSDSIYIGKSSAVTVHGCALRPGVMTYASRVVISDSIIAPFQQGYVGGYGLRVQEGELDFVSSYVQGGSAIGHASSFPGIWVLGDTTLRVRGDASTQVVAGLYNLTADATIRGDLRKGTLILDPRASLKGGAVRGFATRVTQKQVALSAGYSFLGGQSNLKLVGRKGEVGAFWISLDRAPIDIPGIGSWWLEPSTQVLLAAGIFGNDETLKLVLPHSTNPALRGLEIGYQGFSIKGNKLDLSNPVLQVMR